MVMAPPPPPDSQWLSSPKAVGGLLLCPHVWLSSKSHNASGSFCWSGPHTQPHSSAQRRAALRQGRGGGPLGTAFGLPQLVRPIVALQAVLTDVSSHVEKCVHHLL